MKNKKFESVIVSFSSYAVAFLSVAICLIVALTQAIYVPTFHLDGAFQTASGLYRLDFGHLPGRDFYPYLGVGPLLLIFPFYKIFGGDLFATVAAAKFVTIFFSWAAIVTLWHFILRPLNVIHSIAGGALILFGINFLSGHFSLPNVLAFGFEPGNSLRPIRSVIPYLVALFIFFLIKNITNNIACNLLFAVTLGSILLWSNDFAIPTFGLFLIFIIFYKYFFEKNWVSNSLLITIASISVWFFLMSLVTAGHAFDLFKYNFFDIAKDQWWYFAPYRPSSRILEISDLTKLFSIKNYFSICVLLAVFFLAIKTRLIEHWLIFTIGLTSFTGGSVASVGGYLGEYFNAFYFWSVATSLIFSLKVLRLLISYRKSYAFFRPYKLYSLKLHILGLLMIGSILSITLHDYREKLSQAQADLSKFYVDEFGAYLDVSFLEYIDYARKNRELIAIEEYWGLWNSLNRRSSIWPVDSVIHALGNIREITKNSLKNADLIITTRYLTSPAWQPWNLSQNYWFYDELISSWKPIFKSPTTIVWSRSYERQAFERVACHVSTDKSSITLPQSGPGFYRITIEYFSVGGGGETSSNV
jgi:hypothetical protein